ncbi:hypothetical protein LXA43DRAFT_624382 [Ganoderma leucocontextum]|nr:hypothetical protein LXA43DRAFT_624382 [Ganoderma leucocontextum]
MDQDPPSTQVVDRLFVDSANRPLRVFVDAALVNRVKVGRALKRGGANIIPEVKDADIIVVETESQTSNTTIADWESEKVVLESSWVSQSVQRGQAFLADENWGGFVATLAGGGSVASDTGANHLPTPRVTPLEAKLPTHEPPMPNQHSQANASQPVHFASPGPPTTQFPQQAAFQIPGGQPIGGAMPMSAISPDAQVVVPANLLLSLMNQSGMGIAMQMSQMPNQIPMAMAQGGFPQQGMQFIPSGMFPQGGFLPQGGYPQQMVGMPFPQPMDAQSPSGGQLHGSTSPDMRPRNDNISEPYRESPMDKDEPPPSLKRKVRPTDPSASNSKKKKGKAREGGRPSKHARLSESYDEAPLPFANSSPPATQRRRPTSDQIGTLFTKDDGEPYTFFAQIEIRSRTKLADAIKKNGGKIESEIAKVDFVILAHPSQRNFEEWLRQSNYFGKVPMKPQWVYRSVEQGEILDPDEYVYEGFKVEKKRGRPGASGQRYVLKVVKSPTTGGTGSEEDELDEEDEEMDRPPPSSQKGKGKEKVAVKKPTIVKKETVKADKKVEKKAEKGTVKADKKGDRKAEKKSEQRAEPVKAKAKSKTKSKEPSSTPTQVSHWEPSPPPPTRTEPHNRGYLYTKADLDYCDEYIPILLNRDPTMTVMLISERLNEKMPHHSAKSWNSHISTPSWRDKVAKWRRRAEILQRKVTEQRSASRDVRQPTPPRAGPSKSPAELQKVDPFQIISLFFAQGMADTLNDDEVWKTMEGQYPQLTAQQWEEFWVKNNEEVSQEVSRLTGIADSQVPKTEPE